MPPQKNRFYRHMRFFLTTFIDKDLALYASSLSFYTILSIIPLLLVMITLLTYMPSYLDYYEQIKVFILTNLIPINSEIIMGYIDDFISNSLEMGIVSFSVILVASLLFFQNFENIVNKIFHTKRRTLWMSVKTYLLLLIVTPLAIGFSFYITSDPFLIVWGLFFIIFKVIPNIVVDLKASFLASLFVSIVFSISKFIFIYYVVHSKAYATIYGSFSSLMFLFLWIYLLWMIVIYGLKLCYMINRIYKNTQAKAK